MADEKDPNEATEFAETLRRHGDPDPDNWEAGEAVTGRPADKPTTNSTLASRATAAKQRPVVEEKVVDEAENKAVQAAEKMAPARRARKSK